MKKALITGGAGFIGLHLANKLLNNGYRVDIVDNFSRAVKDADLDNISSIREVRIENINLLKSKSTKNLENNYNYIFHLAAIIGVQHVLKNPYKVVEQNFLLLQNALEIAKRQKNLKRFIFTSTSEVYSGALKYHGLDFPTPEITPLTVNPLIEPRTSYMLSKIYGEAMCQYSGIPFTIIRPHNFYGPRMGLSHVIPELMKKVVDSENSYIDVYSVKHRRTFCYIKDAVEIMRLLAESNDTIGNVYNVGNEEEEVTMNELALKIIDLIGKKIVVNPLNSTSGSPKRRCPDISKLNKVINYKKQYSLKKGLQKTFEWYNANVFSGNMVSSI